MIQDISKLAATIAEKRSKLQISPEEMAEHLRLSLEEYLAFEAGSFDLPLTAFHQIAERLGTSLSVLTQEHTPKLGQFTLVRRGKGVQLKEAPNRSYESLASNFKGRGMEPFIVTLERNASPHLSSHTGQELNLVLEGELHLILEEHTFVLSKGDSIYFDATLSHGHGTTTQSVSFLSVTNKD